MHRFRALLLLLSRSRLEWTSMFVQQTHLQTAIEKCRMLIIVFVAQIDRSDSFFPRTFHGRSQFVDLTEHVVAFRMCAFDNVFPLLYSELPFALAVDTRRNIDDMDVIIKVGGVGARENTHTAIAKVCFARFAALHRTTVLIWYELLTRGANDFWTTATRIELWCVVRKWHIVTFCKNAIRADESVLGDTHEVRSVDVRFRSFLVFLHGFEFLAMSTAENTPLPVP